MAAESTLLILLVVLSLGLVIPELFKKSRVPLLTIIILIGAIMGPYGLDYIHLDETIEFFGFLGMAFLMFMAGLETDVTKLSKSKYKIIIMSFINGTIPFLAGVAITKLFGYSWTTSIIVGIIFLSSSVAIIVSSLKENKSITDDVTRLILSAVMICDIISLIALGFIFQTTSKITQLPLYLYFILLLISIFALFQVIPFVSKKILQKKFLQDDGYERQLRFVIVILIGVIVYFTSLGAHPILAAFLAGISLSGVIVHKKSEILKSKLHTIGYGLFIPTFFFVIGMEINFSLFKDFDIKNILMISLILGLMISKFTSGYIAGRFVKLSKKSSMIFGSISITHLTAALAITYAASSIGLLDSVLVTSIILMSIITTIVGPILTSYISSKN